MDTLTGFIVFEGLDGAGTTTQARLLCKSLADTGHAVDQTCEPTDHAIGRLVRKVLAGEERITPKALAMLYAADRDDHLYGEGGIIEKLTTLDYVISDRYLFSSEAYQSIGSPYEEVAELNCRFPMPEYLIYIDTPVEHCMKRIAENRSSRDIFEYEQFQEQVYENYRKALSAYPKELNLLIVDGTKTIEEIHSEIMKLFTNA